MLISQQASVTINQADRQQMELQAILRHARVARPIDVWLALFQGLLQW